MYKSFCPLSIWLFFGWNQPSCFQGYGHLKESQSVAASSTFPGIRIHKSEETGECLANALLYIRGTFVTDCLLKFVGLLKRIEGEAWHFINMTYFHSNKPNKSSGVFFHKSKSCVQYVNKVKKEIHQKRCYFRHDAIYNLLLSVYRNGDGNHMMFYPMRLFHSCP